MVDGLAGRAPVLPKASGKAPLGLKLVYGMGSIAFGVKDNGFSSLLLFFYSQVVGLPAFLAGLSIGIALFADAFIDPFIGQWSDNLHSRWGRRHPFMYASAIPVGVSYLLLWNPPHLDQTGLFIYLTAVAILVRSFISFYEVPSAALAPELTTDYDERTSLLGLRMFFAWLGGLFMSFMAYAVFLKKDATHAVGQLNAEGYVHYGITAAIVMALAILISASGTHHRIKTLSQAPVERRGIGQLLKEMGQAMSNRSFLVLLISSIFSAAATGLVFSMAIYFNTYMWGFPSSTIALYAFISIAAVATSVALAPVLSRVMGKRPATMIVFMIGVAIGSIPLTLRLMGLFLPNSSPLLFPVLAAVHYCSLTLAVAAAILATSMMADVVEDSQVETGRRSEGVFFAANSFIQKAVTGIGLFIAGLLISLAGFPDPASHKPVPPTAVVNLALMYLPTTIGLYGVASLILFGYRITRARHEDNLRTLAEAAALEPAPPG
jgi:Na+/melibiose symporter-like transporter